MQIISEASQAMTDSKKESAANNDGRGSESNKNEWERNAAEGNAEPTEWDVVVGSGWVIGAHHNDEEEHQHKREIPRDKHVSQCPRDECSGNVMSFASE